ncbi:MAG: secondary thiamine-phosphate synthase enzyme YjbQ [Halobacteria archaeon]
MEFTVNTEGRVELRDVSGTVENFVDIEDGLCNVYVRHTTAGVLINENESRLLGDIKDFLEKTVPERDGYGHDKIDDNADSHLRSMLLQSEVTLPVEDGELGLGTWQSLLFFEGDGPRKRTVKVTTVGD